MEKKKPDNSVSEFRKNIEINLIRQSHDVETKLIDTIDLPTVINKLLDSNVANMITEESYLLNKNYFLGKVFYRKFNDTLNYLYRHPNELMTWALNNLESTVWETVEYLFEDNFRYFLPNPDYLNGLIKRQKKRKTISLLDEDFYNFDVSDSEKFLKSLYFLVSLYYLNYFIWLDKITRFFPSYFPEALNKESIDNLNTFYSVIAKKIETTSFLSSEEKWVLLLFWWILRKHLADDIAHIIITHLQWARKKTWYSAILKLLKADKYIEQFDKEWILWDQLWFKVMFYEDDKSKLEKLATYFDPDNKDVKHPLVNKFNDRGVIKIDFSNRDTLAGIFPFVNIGFSDKKHNLPLGELSLRYFSKKDIYELFEQSYSYKDFIANLLRKVDELNHDIYKTAQQIRTIRKLFVDKKILPNKRNFHSSVNQFLDYKEQVVLPKIKNKIVDLLVDLDMNFILKNINLDIVVKHEYYSILKQKVEDVIKSLAWETVSYQIRQTNYFKSLNLSDEEAKKWLNELWAYFEAGLENKDYKLPKNKKNYPKEIFNIYKSYLHNYKYIKKTAIFYGEIQIRLENTKRELFDDKKIAKQVKDKVKNLKSKLNIWD